MRLNEYQELAHGFAQYGGNPKYPYAGLVNEAGELMGVWKKIERKDPNPPSYIDECGDVLWYLSEIATQNETTLESYNALTLHLTVEELMREHEKEEDKKYWSILDLIMMCSSISLWGGKGSPPSTLHVQGAMAYLEYISGKSLEEIADANYLKLFARQKGGYIKGSGETNAERGLKAEYHLFGYDEPSEPYAHRGFAGYMMSVSDLQHIKDFAALFPKPIARDYYQIAVQEPDGTLRKIFDGVFKSEQTGDHSRREYIEWKSV